MSTESIFFSYSRADSETVLQLAKELRAGGASIWLDQLDIKPGVRWDSEIEKALLESNTLLVVLSKTSVDSQNVMDEVSYALEEGMKVVPVLLEDCEIPFRLRRLQYADFCADHDKGMKALVEALGLDSAVASKLTSSTSTPPAKATATKKAPPKIEKPAPVSDQKEEESTLKSKLPMFIIGGLVGILAILYITGVFSSGADGLVTNNEIYDENGEANIEAPFETNQGTSNSTSYKVCLSEDNGLVPVRSDKMFGELIACIAEMGKTSAEYKNACRDVIYPVFRKEGIITFSDPDGARYFSKLLYDYNGSLVYAKDDGKAPKVGDVLICTVQTDIYDAQTQQYVEGQMANVGEIVYVTELSATEDNYLFAYVNYVDF